jgi:hypothetical protein
MMEMPEGETLHQLGLVRYSAAANGKPLDPLLLNPILVMDGQDCVPVDATPKTGISDLKRQVLSATCWIGLQRVVLCRSVVCCVCRSRG